MPLSHKLWNGVTKRVMRDAMRGVLPDKVNERYGKMGFMSAEFQWFYEAPEICTGLIEKLCDAMPGYINKEAVLHWCENHKDGKPCGSNEEYILARMIVAARWTELFQVSIAAKG